MFSSVHSAFYILCILLLVLLIILLTYKMETSSPPYSLKGAYLNYASTNARKHGSLNPSDLAYPQIIEQRSDIERIENKIRKLINAPPYAKVIINSGATESIANCVFWAKSYNKYGIIVGSEYDHSAVKDNCDTFEVPYEQSLRGGKINDKCSMIFLTHVNSKTGELINIENFKRNVVDRYSYQYTDGYNPYNSNVLQYKPLIVLDATQSIMKLPIDMERWGLNAVFFSLHKIGGPIGMGVLVVNDNKNAPFKPLISGKQQHSLRGGTVPLQLLLENEFIFEKFDDFNERKQASEGLKVYEPKGPHLYNTYLIEVNTCPMSIINSLARKNIYVGNTSACKNEETIDGDGEMNETMNETSDESIGGGNKKPFDRAIRISFSKSKEINDHILDEIISEIKNPNN